MPLEIIREEYPANRHTLHISLILEYMLTRGSITHEECEEFTTVRGHKCTVLRSRIPDIKGKLFWPVNRVFEQNSWGVGSHARYSIDLGMLAKEAGLPVRLIQAAARLFREDKQLFYNVGPFLAYAKQRFGPKVNLEKGTIEPLVKNEVPEQKAFWVDFAPMLRAHARADGV